MTRWRCHGCQIVVELEHDPPPDVDVTGTILVTSVDGEKAYHRPAAEVAPACGPMSRESPSAPDFAEVMVPFTVEAWEAVDATGRKLDPFIPRRGGLVVAYEGLSETVKVFRMVSPNRPRWTTLAAACCETMPASHNEAAAVARDIWRYLGTQRSRRTTRRLLNSTEVELEALAHAIATQLPIED